MHVFGICFPFRIYIYIYLQSPRDKSRDLKLQSLPELTLLQHTLEVGESLEPSFPSGLSNTSNPSSVNWASALCRALGVKHAQQGASFCPSPLCFLHGRGELLPSPPREPKPPGVSLGAGIQHLGVASFFILSQEACSLTERASISVGVCGQLHMSTHTLPSIRFFQARRPSFSNFLPNISLLYATHCCVIEHSRKSFSLIWKSHLQTLYSDDELEERKKKGKN